MPTTHIAMLDVDKKAKEQRKIIESQNNPWSDKNMKRDILTAGDNMRSYTNDDYPFGTTEGGYYGGQIGGALGRAGGMATPIPGGGFLGGMIGNSIGKNIDE